MSETNNSLIFNLAAHFAKRNTKFGGGYSKLSANLFSAKRLTAVSPAPAGAGRKKTPPKFLSDTVKQEVNFLILKLTWDFLSCLIYDRSLNILIRFPGDMPSARFIGISDIIN